MVGAVLAFGNPHVEPAGGFPLGAEAVPEIMRPVYDLSEETWIGPVDDFAFEPSRPGMTPDVTAVHERFVGLVEEGVEVADPVKAHLVDDELGSVASEVI